MMSSSKRGFIKRLFKPSPVVHHGVGPSASSAVGLSGESAAVSGLNNSAAASTNLRAASIDLDKYLQNVDTTELESRSSDVISMSRWIEKQEAYSNSSFRNIDVEEVTLSVPEYFLIGLAAVSAEEAYDRPTQTRLLAKGFKLVGEVARLAVGPTGSSIKATSVGMYESTGPAPDTQYTIVIAIRGTASIHDWMVNLNDGPEIPIEDAFMGKDMSDNLYRAHAGFLEGAKEMLPEVAIKLAQVVDNFSQITSKAKKPSLVFTGHSAGGAVAAMLYTHLTNSTSGSDSLIELKHNFSNVHCITFGAPPITTVPIQPVDKTSVLLSIVNEGDPIPRADRQYINSLLRLFVTAMPQGSPKWPLPPCVFANAGKVLLLPKGGGRFLAPRETGEGSLAEMIMGNPKAHKMRLYLEYQQGMAF
ncbi:Alpha/Beta hydrolase protein [Truncatella angustata]|uniref:Alpha/Beta hydrolase protein n=1 Tax=Truncatella angustata TaxID=152316 RepID=A0A9P8ZZW0_9PEZI|nr:Alpha/Beta hydrolase protein [Truncatella angustata]KAH6656434.1 Alpha/Beta hydrolase protein [Truncatella angustata]